ncbi:TonB-dependent receptor [Cellvibrio sp. UBA7661]|uniref:TonB-dependent receptor n=1 Tax=Cellvibrio sp. UBA7661 TaxID=1946311 RepID=UPI002F34F7D7
MTYTSSLGRTYLRNPLFITCTLLPMISAPLALADTTASVEEVVVTASKRNQSLQDFSGSVSVVNDFSGIKNLGDIAAQVPGFSLVDVGPRNPAVLIMRGLRLDEIGSNDLGGDGSAIASYVDNIPLQGYFVPPAFSLKDLQQVEVLRGPQGTLYGNASIGGLIRYVTAKPDVKKYSVRVSGELSQTDHSDDLNYDSDLVVNTPLIEDTLALRLMLGKTENAGFIDNPYLLSGAQDDINDDETKQARISLLWQASDNFSLNSSYHYQKINVGDRQATNESFTGDEYAASSRYLQPMQGELQLASIDANYEMPWATLTASLNHYDYAHHERADQTDLYIGLDPTVEYYNLYENLSAYNASDIDIVKDSAELRLVSPDNQRLRWLVGAFYSRDDLDAYMGDYTPGLGEFFEMDLPGDLEYLATQTETLDEYSTYAEVTYDLTEKWEATVGARHFRYDDDLDVCISYFPGPIEDCSNGDDVSKDTLGKFSTSYKFSDDKKIYFLAAEGYRRGGANTAPAEVLNNRFYRPDVATNYELGFHSLWLAQRLELNAALFNIEWDDLQVQLETVDGRTAWDNAGKARTKGIEFDASAQLSDAFALHAGYAYTDAEITESVAEIGVYSGNQLPGSPRTQWSLSLDFNQEFNGTLWDASIGVNRIGDVATALNPEFSNYQKLDSYSIASARVGVTRGNWRLGAFVNNIDNTRAITSGRADDFFGEQGQFEYITRPRTIGLSVSYQY